MEVVTPGPNTEWRHPTGLELGAGILLVATVVLHVVAMFPTYFGGPAGHASLFSQADQAASYSVLAAGWALVLGIGLTGPSRIPICAGLATGLAATEFGFRVSDVGAVIRYGSDLGGTGLWIMVAAWVTGAAAAGVLLEAARQRRQRAGGASPVAAGEQARDSGWEGATPAALLATATDSGGATATDTDLPARTEGDPLATTPERAPTPIFWTAVLGVLGLITAVFFLPSWDHYVGVATSTGRTFSFDLGNAFSGPWEVVLGNVLVAVAIVAIALVGSRLHDRGVVAAAVGGSLIVLSSQFVSAVVQVDEPVSLANIPARYLELGSQFGIKLTAWFTIDVLAAFVLFAAVMVWATSRIVYANSRGTLPKAPELRSEAMPSAS